MAVTSLSAKTSLDTLAAQIANDFPAFTFRAGSTNMWSPELQTITYSPREEGSEQAAIWSLLHETAHALLGHTTYASDFQLLRMELAAWQEACTLAERYGIIISEGHINQCLESYRDWLHLRSKCPRCDVHGTQEAPTLYACINCHASWRVADSRHSRPYRKTTKTPA